MPLGIEIYFFDHGEWDLHVTQAQYYAGQAVEFTNADLFYCVVAIFTVTTLLLHFHFSVRKPE